MNSRSPTKQPVPPLLRLVRSGRHARQAHVGGDFLLDYDADDDFVEFVSSFRVVRTMKDWGVEDSPTDVSCRLIPPSCFTRSSAILNPAAVGPEAITFARAITAPTRARQLRARRHLSSSWGSGTDRGYYRARSQCRHKGAQGTGRRRKIEPVSFSDGVSLSPSRCFRLRRRTDRHHPTRVPIRLLQAASRASPGLRPSQDRRA